MARKLPRALTTVAALASISLLASCGTYSVHPLYDAKTVFFEPALVGTWVGSGEAPRQERITFAKTQGRSYEAEYFDPNGDVAATHLYDVALVKLGGRLFLDATERAVRVGGQEVNTEGIDSHLIARVSIDGDTLRINLLDDDWLRKGFNSGKLSVAHETEGDNVVLTASTAELQSFVSGHAGDDQAFPPADPFIRAK